MKINFLILLAIGLLTFNALAAQLRYDVVCEGSVRRPSDGRDPNLKMYIKSDFSEEGPKLIKYTAGRSKRPIGPAQDLSIKRVNDADDTLTISGSISGKFAGGGQAHYELKINKNDGNAVYTATISTFDESSGQRVGTSIPHSMTCTAAAR